MYHPNKAALACVKSMEWFQQKYENSVIQSNFYELSWYTSFNGIIIHLVQVVDFVEQTPEFRNKAKEDVESFKSFFRIFSFVVVTSKKYYMPIDTTFKKKRMKAESIIRRMYVDFGFQDGHGVDMDDFSFRRTRRTQGQDWVDIVSVPDDRTRTLLNQLFNG